MKTQHHQPQHTQQRSTYAPKRESYSPPSRERVSTPTRIYGRVKSMGQAIARPFTPSSEAKRKRKTQMIRGFIGDTLEEAFETMCKTYNKDTMDNAIYNQFCKETKIYDKWFGKHSAGAIWEQATKQGGGNTVMSYNSNSSGQSDSVDYDTFKKHIVSMIAERKMMSFEELRDQLLDSPSKRKMDESFRVGDDLAIQMKQEAKKNNHVYADGGVMQSMFGPSGGSQNTPSYTNVQYLY